MNARHLLLHLGAAAALAGSPLAAAGDAPAFPLVTTEAASAPGELELRLVDARLDGLLEVDALVFPDVRLPGGASVDLELARIDLKRLAVGVHVDGRLRADAVEPLSLSVWQGTLRGVPDSEVSLSFSRFGCHGWLRSGDRLLHLVSGADPQDGWARARTRWIDDEVLRATTGPVEVRCAGDDLRVEDAGGSGTPLTPAAGAAPSTSTQALTQGSPTYVASIAVETDHQYFQVFGDVNAATAYVVSLFAWASHRYEQQLGTVLTLPYLNFYTTPADPWTTPDSGGDCVAMIYELQAAWQGNVPLGADIGHFLSGANLGCGAGFIGGLCDPLRNFSVSGNGNGQVQFPVTPSSSNLDFYAVTHELGHNFGAIHTHDYCPPLDECAPAGYFGACQTQQACTYPGTLMSYCHACGGFGNISTWFHPQSALDMRAWVETNGCLPTLCPTPLAYCASQTNSDGCAPAIGWTGEPSLSGPDDFHVVLPDVPANKSGLLFFGFAPASQPLLGGTLCVQAPQVRTPVSSSGGLAGWPCDGGFDFFWSQAFSGAQGLTAGTTVFAQFWYRDPGAAQGVGLSDGLEFTLCP